MKIMYQFANGDFSEIEVSEELGELLLALDQQERNNDRKETRRHDSLEGMAYEGAAFTAADDTAGEALLELDAQRLRRAMEALPPRQRDLLRQIYFENRSIASIAREEGVSKQAVHDRLGRILKKIKKDLD